MKPRRYQVSLAIVRPVPVVTRPAPLWVVARTTPGGRHALERDHVDVGDRVGGDERRRGDGQPAKNWTFGVVERPVTLSRASYQTGLPAATANGTLFSCQLVPCPAVTAPAESLRMPPGVGRVLGDRPGRRLGERPAADGVRADRQLGEVVEVVDERAGSLKYAGIGALSKTEAPGSGPAVVS
jgi:hypothetical protein